MKQVIIIFKTDSNENAINFIKQNLEEVFGQYVNFTNYFLQKLAPGAKLTADAFLALNEQTFRDAEGFVDDFSHRVKINRSPGREALSQISQIPSGATVLVVNDSYESALDTVHSFYEVGVSHINMIAYDRDLEKTGIYDHIDIAVTPAEPHLVPKHIKNVVDTGYRKVSFDTMFKLMKLLDLDVATINRNLFRHIHSIVESNTAFHANYIFGYLKSEMLSRIVNTSKIGMVLVDNSYDMVYLNDKAVKILQSDGRNSVKISDYIDPYILSGTDLHSGPMRILGKSYYFDKYPITLMEEVIGYYITLQDEAAVEPASKFNRQKGFTAKHQFKDIIHVSDQMDRVIQTARQIALTDHTVLIRGESGAGKELIAQSIHNGSYRNKYPFVAVNCAALPDNLLESELFGYEAGAFTGAHTKGKMGLFEVANRGTIFLDEIGDISPQLQSRLLRTIQERQIMRVGSDRLIDVDIRLITATNKDLEAAVREGQFRSDLFFRLNVLPITVPPLRRRKEDIGTLLQYFLGSEYRRVTEEEMKILMAYDWPGNIRELENAATYYKTLSTLPEYISMTDSYQSGQADAASINGRVLRLISKYTELSHGIGRTMLLQELLDTGVHISDGKLRSILTQLEEDGFVTIGKGRYGTRITEVGRAALRGKPAESGKDL